MPGATSDHVAMKKEIYSGVSPRLGAWSRGMISMKQVSLKDVSRHIFAANYSKGDTIEKKKTVRKR